MAEEVQKALKIELEKFKQVQKDYQKAVNQRQQLDGQLNENIAVKKELDLLKSENEVFKLIGPVLIKQDLVEAKENVAKRMEYISTELKRVEDMIAGLDKTEDAHREIIAKYHKQLLEAQRVAVPT